MLEHDYDRSFIAHVSSTTAGLEGYLDCAKVVEKGVQVARVADDWLILTSLTVGEPHYFWFRCMVDEARGRRYYDIQSWSRRTGRDFNARTRHLDRNGNGYGCLYDTPVSDDRLWKLMAQNQDGGFSSLDQAPRAGESLPVRIWTRTTNLELGATGREDVGGHWFAYARAGDGHALDLQLQITHIGEELLDDH